MKFPEHQSIELVYARDLPLFKHEKPYSVLTYFKEDQVSSNIKWEEGKTEDIHNIRGKEEDFKLDTHGFYFRTIPTAFTQWDVPKLVEKCYLSEVSELLKNNVDGADHVEVFDWRVSCCLLFSHSSIH